MTNPATLLTSNSVFEWNQWRKENPDIIPNLSGIDLTKQDLRNINLSWAILVNANLTGVNLSNANCRNANFQGANLTETIIDNSNFSKANMVNTKLAKSYINKTDFSGADLSQSNLSRANLIECYLIKANLKLGILTESNLSNSYLIQANLMDAKLVNSNLNNVDLSNANAIGTDFMKADLTGVTIEDWVVDRTTKLDQVYCNYFYCELRQKITNNESSLVNFETLINKINRENIVETEKNIPDDSATPALLNRNIPYTQKKNEQVNSKQQYLASSIKRLQSRWTNSNNSFSA
ncbi:MAG: pentapeptide repeat-containing protein [Cyanobacterium sp.]